jgi:hypothetical protein
MAALVRMTADLRAVFAAHVALEIVDRRRLRPPHNVECDRLVSVAAEAADLKIAVAGVKRIAERGRRLGGPLVAQHALVPGLARQTISFLSRLSGALCRCPYRSTVKILARLRSHQVRVRELGSIIKPLRLVDWSGISPRSASGNT